MKLTIITPCSRPYNLPSIYESILNMNSDDVEWIVVFDNIDIDYRILSYQENVPIKLFTSKRNEGDNYASRQRNVGINNSTGDYLYFLDDDNLVHKFLYNKINLYGNGDNVIIFNQFTKKIQRKFPEKINIEDYLKKGKIDTAQFLVPRKYKTRWKHNRKMIEEWDYGLDLLDEIGIENFLYVDRLYTFYNYLRRFDMY